jgi:phosphoribosylamine-glycine ligase
MDLNWPSRTKLLCAIASFVAARSTCHAAHVRYQVTEIPAMYSGIAVTVYAMGMNARGQVIVEERVDRSDLQLDQYFEWDHGTMTPIAHEVRAINDLDDGIGTGYIGDAYSPIIWHGNQQSG